MKNDPITGEADLCIGGKNRDKKKDGKGLTEKERQKLEQLRR